MFQLTNTLIDSNKLFDSQGTDILKSTLKIYKNQQVLSLTEIVNMTGTYEAKILKFKNQCLNNLRTKLVVLKSYENQLNSKYQIQSEGDIIVIDEKKADEINSISETIFSKQFITYILSIFLSEQFVTIGNVSDALIVRYGHPMGRHEWKNIYLVRKEIDYSINFEKFIEDIGSRLDERITESYSFNLASYLSRFGRVKKVADYNQLTPIAELFLYHEFGLVVDLNDNVTFERNTVKKVSEYAVEALKTLGSPSRVDVIFHKVKELCPEFTKDENSIQASMTRQKGFVPIGRKSIYGLKEWEKTLKNFKGGTIRNIVKEFLENHKTPMHLDDIVTAVLKFRPKSNKTSIITNLQLDKSNTFNFFKGHIVGLKSNSYHESESFHKRFKSVNHSSWDERFHALKKFVDDNGRLPNTRNSPKIEQRLYYWYYRQIKAVEKGKLQKEAFDKIQNITSKFSNEKRIYRNTAELYILLSAFIKSNHRVPKARDKEEYRLYSFLYKKTKRYNEGQLSNEELGEYIKIKQLLSEI